LFHTDQGNKDRAHLLQEQKNWADYEKVIAEKVLPTLKQGAFSHTSSTLLAIRTKTTSEQFRMENKLLT
jgi:hypothetical protein